MFCFLRRHAQTLQSLILPRFEFCSPLVLGIVNMLNDSLEDGNYYILRSLTGHTKITGYDFLLNLAGIYTLDHRRHYRTLVLLYESLHASGPTYIKDLFSFRLNHYNLRGTGIKVEQPRFNINWMKNSFSFIVSRLWNNLPILLRWLSKVILLALGTKLFSSRLHGP